jgi:hypothetical protein
MDRPRVTRRPQWRGDRKAVLVRLPVGVAARLAAAARECEVSVSEHAAGLIASALGDRSDVA